NNLTLLNPNTRSIHFLTSCSDISLQALHTDERNQEICSPSPKQKQRKGESNGFTRRVPVNIASTASVVLPPKREWQAARPRRRQHALLPPCAANFHMFGP
ncbi:hypothetical protein Dimus_030776, partial [Dionaea muscipula]